MVDHLSPTLIASAFDEVPDHCGIELGEFRATYILTGQLADSVPQALEVHYYWLPVRPHGPSSCSGELVGTDDRPVVPYLYGAVRQGIHDQPSDAMSAEISRL